MIQLQNVTKRIKENTVLDNVSYTFKSGFVYGLYGQNGSGKSTLLKLLADLFVPTKGKILINNVDLREIKQESYWGKIAPVFQDFSKFKFSIGDSISFGKMGEVEKALEDLRAKGAEKFFVSGHSQGGCCES